MALTKPTQIKVPFASSGLKNAIPVNDSGSNRASMQKGFPAITMQNVDNGGLPPYGEDINGIIYDVTKAIQYQQAGGLFPYDAAFAAAIDGYPLGAILTSADGTKLYQNLLNGNQSNPENGGANWKEITDLPIKATGSTTAWSLSDRFADIINVKDYGAKGDGITDDTAAIQAALDAAESADKICFGTGTFKITNTVKINCSCDFSSATFNIDATNMTTAAIEIGKKTSVVGELVRQKQISLPRLVNTGMPYTMSQPWTNFLSTVGVQVFYVMECEITFRSIERFFVGFLMSGYGGGCAYNTVNLGVIIYCHSPLKLYNLDVDNSLGWVNQNLFLGGRMQMYEPTVTAFTGNEVSIELGHDAAGHGPNNNTFIGQCVEAKNIKYNLLVSGAYNLFLNLRYEYTYKVCFKAADGQSTWHNIVDAGYNNNGALVVTKDVTGTGDARFNTIRGSGFYKSESRLGGFHAFGQYGTAPHLRGYGAVDVVDAAVDDTSWLWQLSYMDGLETKSSSVTPYPQVRVKGNVAIGDGSVDPYIRIWANLTYKQLIIDSSDPDNDLLYVLPKDNVTSLGYSNAKWKAFFAKQAHIDSITTDRILFGESIQNPYIRIWANLTYKQLIIDSSDPDNDLLYVLPKDNVTSLGYSNSKWKDFFAKQAHIDQLKDSSVTATVGGVSTSKTLAGWIEYFDARLTAGGL